MNDSALSLAVRDFCASIISGRSQLDDLIARAAFGDDPLRAIELARQHLEQRSAWRRERLQACIDSLGPSHIRNDLEVILNAEQVAHVPAQAKGGAS